MFKKVLPLYLKNYTTLSSLPPSDIHDVRELRELIFNSLTRPDASVCKKRIASMSVPYDYDGELRLGKDIVSIVRDNAEKPLLVVEPTDGNKINLYIGHGYTNIFEEHNSTSKEMKRILSVWLMDYLFKTFNERVVINSSFFEVYWLSN